MRSRGLVLAILAGAVACGSRSELDVGPAVPPKAECDVDSDCPGHDDPCNLATCIDPKEHMDELPDLPAGKELPPRVCAVLDPVDCDDNDPCTADECVGLPMGAHCSYGPSTFDLDGDGHRAPLPGKMAGEEGSCGDDCNDAAEAAFPGNTEVCDGVDNDCNGIVDDGANFVPLDTQPSRISSDSITPAEPGGLAFSGDSYISTYTGWKDGGADMYQTRILPSGEKVEPIEQKFTFQNADSYGAPIVWIGDRYGIAWQDRRDGSYEAYFTVLKSDGGKAYPDTRLSFAAGFSVNVDLAWNGTEFIVVWQDDRNGLFEVMAQRVSVDSVPVGSNITLSNPEGFDDEAPAVASGTSSVGVAWANGQAGIQVLRFRTFQQTTLEPRSELMTVTDGMSEAVYPSVVWNEDRYVISWFVRSGATRAVYAATYDEDGVVLTPPTAVSQPPGNAASRYPTMLALGDRLLFVYADDRDGNSGYELYTRMVTSELLPLTGETRLTNAPFDSIKPTATFGPEGNVGILFRDDRENGADHVWFTRLACVTQ